MQATVLIGVGCRHPGVVPWLGSRRGPVNSGWGELTIQLMQAAADSGALIEP